MFGQETQIIPEKQNKVGEYQTYQLTERQNQVFGRSGIMKNWTHFEGDQTKQIYGMYGNVEGFLLTSALFGLDILTPVDDFRLSKKTKSSKTKLVWK